MRFFLSPFYSLFLVLISPEACLFFSLFSRGEDTSVRQRREKTAGERGGNFHRVSFLIFSFCPAFFGGVIRFSCDAVSLSVPFPFLSYLHFFGRERAWVFLGSTRARVSGPPTSFASLSSGDHTYIHESVRPNARGGRGGRGIFAGYLRTGGFLGVMNEWEGFYQERAYI